MKIMAFGFASSFGKHTVNSLGKDLDYHSLAKIGVGIGASALSSKHFHAGSAAMVKNEALMNGGIRIAGAVTAKLIENGFNSISNRSAKKIPLMTKDTNTKLGENKARYINTNCHVGVKTSSRIEKNKTAPNMEVSRKILADTNRDYFEHKRRKNLTVDCGFNQKGHTFLMEDTYMRVDDYYTIYNTNKRIENLVEKRKNGIKNGYGSAIKTLTKFKFINRFDFYNVNVTLHMIKIVDLKSDVRSLVQQLTNNNCKSRTEDNKIREMTSVMVDKAKKKLVKELKKKVSDLDIKIDDFTKSEKLSKVIEVEDNYGKIPEDLQYSDPLIDDEENRATLSFKTALNCSLTDSLRFNDRAVIVKSWRRTLSPGSIWDFRMHHHLGKGIHLNYLHDIKQMGGKDHPTGYIFVLEYIGDKRARIVRNEDKDFFQGYSPCKLHMEFSNELTFLVDTKESEFEKAATYLTKKKETDFEENSEFEEIFTPNREPAFSVDLDDIKVASSEDNQEKSYTLEYDKNIMEVNSNALLDEVARQLEKIGMDPENASEDDLKYAKAAGKENPNLRGKEYHGTEGDDIDEILED